MPNKFLWIWAIILVCPLFAFGCDSGGGGASSSLVISNVVLLDGSGGITFTLDYVDDAGGAPAITVNIYDADQILVRTLHPSVQLLSAGLQSASSGSLEGTLDLASLPGGAYSLTLFMTDGGAQSNTLMGNFSAVGGFGQDINYPNPQAFLFMGDTAIGDLNGDGRNDAAAIQGSNNTGLLLLYYQNASGGFNSPVSVNLGIQTRGLVIADVNNDGLDDVVVSGLDNTVLIGWPGRVLVLLQNPTTGQLQLPQAYTINSSTVGKITVADLNGDGRQDVAAAVPDSPNSHLSFFFQNNSGTLNDEVVYSVSVTFREIHAADMDDDGDNDIVVLSGSKELSVIKQVSPGVFSATPEVYTGQTSYWPYLSAFALGDLNGDGRTDLVAVDPGNDGYLNIFLQNTQGALDAPVLVQQNLLPFGVKIMDITGDGLNDIVADVSPGVVVFSQAADHTFGNYDYYNYQSQSFGGSNVTNALSLGDVTGDGMPDAILTWSDEGLFVLPYEAQITIE